jgi:type I restriction enzyme S subunit
MESMKLDLVEFGSIMSMVKGKKPIAQSNNKQDGFVPYINIKAFEKGEIEQYAHPEKCIACNENDLLIVCDGSRSGLVGKAKEGVVGSTLAKISATGITTDYLYYFLQGKYEILNSRTKGTGTPHVDPEVLRNFRLVIPDFSVQEQIVRRIEELFSELDKAIETLHTIKKQLETYRQAVLKEAFDNHFGKIKLEELCSFITKGTTPPKDTMGVKGQIPFIKVYNLTFSGALDFSINPTFITEEIHRSILRRSIVYPGDVLMNIVGPPMGKISIVPNTYHEWNINQAIVRFRCGKKLYNKYLAYYLSSSATVESMNSQSKATAGQFNLTLQICRNIEIPLPEFFIQFQIVEEIESRLSVCDYIEQMVDSAIEQSDALRKSILKQAFEGRLI